MNVTWTLQKNYFRLFLNYRKLVFQVVDGNRNLEEMMQFYRANNQYLLGMEKWPHYHSVQEAVC